MDAEAILNSLPFGVCVIACDEAKQFSLIRSNAQVAALLGRSDPFALDAACGKDKNFIPLCTEPNFQNTIKTCRDGGADHPMSGQFSWRTEIAGIARIFACELHPLAGPTPDTFILVFSDRTLDALSEQQSLHNSLHDPLTLLPNHVLFSLKLSEQLELQPARTLTAVLMLNLNRFQMINESLSHLAGDKLLADVAARLKRAMPATALTARLGSDEFSVLLPNLADRSEASALAETIHACLKAPFHNGGQDIYLTASIGIALTSPRVHHAEELLRNTSIAMHRAKREGLAKTIIYHDDLKTRAQSQFKFEADLRRALDQGELSLHYQPIVALATGELIGFEALSRWHHVERGSVPPAEFIAVAETSGLIVPLGRWALNTACRQLAAWKRLYPAAANLSLNVNVSGLQISEGNLTTVVQDALITSGLAGEYLKLEITESALMTNAELAADLLLDLKSFGVGLALDDFGTGYSSLSYLNRFPIDTLKIDRSFIRNLGTNRDDHKIVHIITMLASALGLTAVAEGIESEDQLSRLNALGCHFGQGFLFSRPLPADDASALLLKGVTTLPLTKTP